ncbi:hypothetical protein ACA910_006320 [Epithemia clementina (nom. ined.)]
MREQPMSPPSLIRRPRTMRRQVVLVEPSYRLLWVTTTAVIVVALSSPTTSSLVAVHAFQQPQQHLQRHTAQSSLQQQQHQVPTRSGPASQRSSASCCFGTSSSNNEMNSHNHHHHSSSLHVLRQLQPLQPGQKKKQNNGSAAGGVTTKAMSATALHYANSVSYDGDSAAVVYKKPRPQLPQHATTTSESTNPSKTTSATAIANALEPLVPPVNQHSEEPSSTTFTATNPLKATTPAATAAASKKSGTAKKMSKTMTTKTPTLTSASPILLVQKQPKQPRGAGEPTLKQQEQQQQPALKSELQLGDEPREPATSNSNKGKNRSSNNNNSKNFQIEGREDENNNKDEDNAVASLDDTQKTMKSSTKIKSSNKFLTREQEVQYAYDLRTMRCAIRIRDGLVREQDGMYIHPTELQWAQAYCQSERANQTLKVLDNPTKPPLSDKAAIWRLRLIMHKGQAARTALCTCNGGLVTSMAKKHYANFKQALSQTPGSVGTILTVSDLIQEGNLGLMEAAERFCPEKGVRFSTYAVYWIRQRICRSAYEVGRAIRLPAHVHGLLNKVRRAKLELLQEQQGQATSSAQPLPQAAQPNIRSTSQRLSENQPLQFMGDENDSSLSPGIPSTSPASLSAELAKRVGVSEERLRLYQESSRNVVSLEAPLLNGARQSSSGGGSAGGKRASETVQTLGDLVSCDAPTPEEEAQYNAMRQDVWQVMETELTPVERQVIMHRFGFLQQQGGGGAWNMDGNNKNKNRALLTGGVIGGGTTVADTARALNLSRDRVRLVEARALNKLRHPQKNYRLRNYVDHPSSEADSTASYGNNIHPRHHRHPMTTKRPSTTSAYSLVSSSAKPSVPTSTATTTPTTTSFLPPQRRRRRASTSSSSGSTTTTTSSSLARRKAASTVKSSKQQQKKTPSVTFLQTNAASRHNNNNKKTTSQQQFLVTATTLSPTSKSAATTTVESPWSWSDYDHPHFSNNEYYSFATTQPQQNYQDDHHEMSTSSSFQSTKNRPSSAHVPDRMWFF